MIWEKWNERVRSENRLESPKKNNRSANIVKPTHIVIHVTGTDNYEVVKNRFLHVVSVHYLVKPDGEIVQFVRDKDRAWHAGISSYVRRLYDKGTGEWKKYLRYFNWFKGYKDGSVYVDADLNITTDQTKKALVMTPDGSPWRHYDFWDTRHDSSMVYPINYLADKDPNNYSIGIELLTYGGKDSSAFTPQMYKGLAMLVRDLCLKYDIPVDRFHIVGHEDVNPVERWGWDPGEGFNWGDFILAVRG